MLQKILHTHELFEKDDTIEILQRIYQDDHGQIELTIAFERDGEPVDLAPYVVSVSNRAPNNAKLVMIADVDSPVHVDGNTLVWVFDQFDTQQVGTYTAQIHVASEDLVVTAAFVKYNVERSVTGKLVTVPVRHTSLTELAEQVSRFREEVNALNEKAEYLSGQYDVFQKILDDSDISWPTLPEKPDTFPPSNHTHEQYEEKTVVAALASDVEVNTAAIQLLGEQKADRAYALTGILWASAWEGQSAPYTQTIEVPGMKRYGLYAVEFEHSDVVAVQTAKETQWGYIGTFIQGDGTVTARCMQVKPGVDFRLQFIYLGSEVEP